MSSPQVIPEGYKQTEVGVIPDDWDVKTIGEFAPLQRGFDLPNRERQLGVYPVVYSNGIVNYHDEYQVKGPGVVTGRSGTIGKVHYVSDDYWPHNTSLWVKKFNNALPKYVYYLYEQIGFIRFVSGSGVPTLNRNDAHLFNLAVPNTIEEQTAIANALSDVDALLSELENLIVKKQAIKTATMQQLLTGKTRLPQFATYTDGDKQGQIKGNKPSELGEIPEDWEVKLFGECFSIIAGLGFNKSEYTQNGLNLLRIDNVSYGKVIWDSIAYLPENYRSKYPHLILKAGDLLLALNRPITNGQLKFAKLSKSDLPSILYQRVGKISTLSDDVDASFAYFLLAKFIKLFVEGSAVGTDQPFISTTKLKQCVLPLPPVKEQTAIATILSDMDAEIQALKQRLSKTRQIKQGMMQELLTGKTRLPFDKSGLQV